MKVMKGFESRRQMPNCRGAIDCSHILISTPSICDHKAYHDRNHQVSVILQAVVDSQGRFLDVFAGLRLLVLTGSLDSDASCKPCCWCFAYYAIVHSPGATHKVASWQSCAAFAKIVGKMLFWLSASLDAAVWLTTTGAHKL